MNNVDRKIIGIAKVAHETNRSFCQTLGDFSQPTWVDAPGWQQENVLQNVKYLLRGERTLEDLHEHGRQHLLTEGWRRGETLDPEKKEHPDLIPYDELSWESKFKDALFLSVVMALTPLVADAALGGDHG